VRCCPTGIDIRDGLQMECIACAECIDACRPIMLKLKRQPDLIAYFFGEPGAARRLLRPATLALGAVTLLSLGATVAAARSAAVTTLDLTVVPDSTFPTRRAPDGRSLAAYVVSLESRARATVTVRLSAEAGGAALTVRPASLALAPGEHRRLRVVVEARGPGGRLAAQLVADAAGEGTEPFRRTSSILLVLPEPR
jgi:polyferredoxin